MKILILMLAFTSAVPCFVLRAEEPAKDQVEDFKQADLLSELKESPDGVLRVKTNEDGSFKSLVVKASVEVEDVLGAAKAKQIARKEAEIQCKKYLAQWLNDNCVFVEGANNTVTIQTKGEETKDAAGKTVKVRNKQSQESKLITESSASLAQATLKGLTVVSSELEDSEFVLMMALTQKSLGQSEAIAKSLSGDSPGTEKSGSSGSSDLKSHPSPKKELDPDALDDL
jgi:hypothetical protein